MHTLFRISAVVAFIVAMGVYGRGQTGPAAADNVILITLDGARIDEVFGGMQLSILQSTLAEGQKAEDSATYRRFWSDIS